MECLITGIKGFGKTAHALDLVFFQNSEFKNLNVYVEGIGFTDLGHEQCKHFDFPLLADLKRPDYQPLSSVDNDDEEADKYKPWVKSSIDHADFIEARAIAKHPLELWFLWAQKGSVLLIDEIQRFARPRPSGSKSPLWIRMIEYARHYGLHFVFLSQAPRLIDINLRSHVEKHIHLTKTWKGGIKYEFVECGDIDSKTAKKDAVKSSYSPPKHIFPLYTSSSMHLKVKHKIPKAILILALSIPIFFALIWYIVAKVKSDHGIKPNNGVSSGQISSAPKESIIPASGVTSFDEGKIKKYISEFQPVVPSLPNSAPAYDSLRRVVSMPLISACVANKTKCSCYSQQGTKLHSISVDRCQAILNNGVEFDPYKASAPSNDLPVTSASKYQNEALNGLPSDSEHPWVTLDRSQKKSPLIHIDNNLNIDNINNQESDERGATLGAPVAAAAA